MNQHKCNELCPIKHIKPTQEKQDGRIRREFMTMEEITGKEESDWEDGLFKILQDWKTGEEHSSAITDCIKQTISKLLKDKDMECIVQLAARDSTHEQKLTILKAKIQELPRMKARNSGVFPSQDYVLVRRVLSLFDTKEDKVDLYPPDTEGRI